MIQQSDNTLDSAVVEELPQEAVEEELEQEEQSITILTSRQELFCIGYTSLESKTYGDGTLSAIAAGYAKPSASNASWKLKKNVKIQARLAELYAENSLAESRVFSDIESLRRLAITKDNLAVAAQCAKLLCQRLGALVDRHTIEVPDARQLSADEKVEAQKIARWYIEQDND